MERSRNSRHGEDPRRTSRRSHREEPSETDHRKRQRHRSSAPGIPEAPVPCWDGVLGPTESIVFHLDFDWDPFRTILTRVLFHRGGFLTGEKAVQEDFWLFFERFWSKLSQQPGITETASGPKLELKNPLKSINVTPKNFNLVHRYRFVRSDDEDSPEIPSHALKSFHYVVLRYFDFLEKQEFQKLKKLRLTQAQLPIANYRQRILDLVRTNPLVIVSGDTGCGKSTQVPQYLLKAGFERVCCTQPRRIACISLSKRVAYETLNEYGSQVAYQIRFEKTKTVHTRIVFMTEGLLLRQIGSDPMLAQHEVLVLDEVHERHLHSDFLLGVVRCLIEQRPELKIVLMSATINIQLFADYFNSAPVVQVPGRLYPIQVHYTPISAESRSSSRLNPGPYVRVLEMIDNKYPAKERGDVLIFLSGINEITTVAEAASEYAEKTRRWIILSLHSSLSLAEQDKVFDIAPEGVRKCIIATNIAETSVTIDGIRFVVDSGRVKEMSYDPKYHMQRLQEFWISQASAEQRRGRAGRTGPGVCYRMYQQSDYDAFSMYSTPEIQRVPLDSLILQMIAMGLTEVRQFPFIEPPSSTTIEQSIANLKSHGALTPDEELTPVGKALAKLPLDVTIGKILISGTLICSLLQPVLFVTAALSIQSPFTNRAFRDLETRSLLEKLFSSHGDSLTLLQVFHAWLEEKKKLLDRSEGSKRWCRKRGIEEQRLYEITKLYGQFREILEEHGLLNSAKQQEEIQADRSQRKGEMKQLRFLKRSLQRSNKTRKVLSLAEDSVASDEEKGDDDVDIQDVEFQLRNDRSNVEEMFEASGNLTDHEIRILKLILCSGLYPNIAIADECNSFKADQDQIFHTKSKMFVVLHPTSVFAFQPDVLTVKETGEPQQLQAGGSGLRRGTYSDHHQLLIYVNLMETNKPYLMNCLRVPALQTLLLFSTSVDTNLDCTRIVFDGWIDVYVTNPIDGQEILEMAAWIRSLWKKLMDLRLLESQVSAVESGRKSRETAKVMERDLVAKLATFVSTGTVYAIKRLLAADMKTLYLGHTELPMSETSVLTDNTVKGGVDVFEYLTYNCLGDTSVLSSDIKWTCPKCEEYFSLTVFDRITHFVTCLDKESSYEAFCEAPMEEKSRNPLAKEFVCHQCDKTLFLTPAEILKHNRLHGNA